MKIVNYLLLATVLVSAINCTSAPKTTTANISVNVQNSSTESQASAQATPAAESQARTETPDALLKDLYKTHAREGSRIINGENRTLIDKYFDKNLGDLIWKDQTTHVGEIGVIDFDLFYNTQDPEIKKLAVGAPKIDGDKATVTVTFENYGQKNTLVYSLVKERNAWKIADINYGKNDSLLKYFKDTNESIKNASGASGEFEGKYRVGDTICTVKPVKMAFEVRWEKGSGVEMFFFEDRANDRYIFASSPDAGKANSFAFNDENYNTGTFYRADGKEFPIERIK